MASVDKMPDLSKVDLFSRRLLIVAGKGGVGRTSAACALALSAAGQGKRVLLAQTKSNERLGPLLGIQGSLSTIQKIRENLWAVCMTPEAALEEYGSMIFRSAFLYRQIFDRDIVRSLLRTVPGLFDYAMLGKVYYHTTEQSKGQPRFDLVILDGPATGHLLSLLQIPRSILRLVQSGPLSTPARECQNLLTDAKRCLAIIVTLAEELPISESLELTHQLSHLDLALGAIIINRLHPSRFSKAPFAEVLEQLASASLPRILQPLVEVASLQKKRALLDQQYIDQLLRDLPLPQIHLPYLFESQFQLPAIEQLSLSINQQLRCIPQYK